MAASYQYMSISADDIETSAGNDVVVDKYSINSKRILFLVVFAVTFCFYGFCVYHAMAPIELFIDQHEIRRLQDASTGECTLSGVATTTTVCAVAGAAVVLGAFLVVGLSPIGPIAGGLFAANMGAGLATGSFMAIAQSAAMTGVTYATGAAVGAAGGSAYACA